MTHRIFSKGTAPLLAALAIVTLSAAATAALPDKVALETPFLRFQITPETGAYEIVDRSGGVTWRSNPFQPRFGAASLEVNGQPRSVVLDRCEVRQAGRTLEATFHPLADRPAAWLRVAVRVLDDRKSLEFSYTADPELRVRSVRLLEDAFWVSDVDQGYLVVPVREGMIVPAGSGLAFTHSFDTFAYEGCHMEMLGVVKGGAALLLSWHDPYVLAEVKSTLAPASGAKGKQTLSTSLVLRESARSVRAQFLGRGDYVTVARAYLPVAQAKGWRVTWAEKLKGHPERTRLFGAVNYKLWSTLDRSMNEESTREESSRVNWTFDEAAQVAKHLKTDLKLDKVLFLMGGWIRRGYDNQHPDILPAAPECGGNEAFAECSRRIRNLGYVLGLHDNYQDMYRDAPSWDESYLTRNRDQSLAKGGRWAGGRAYLTCSLKALELAQRPQNLPAVKQLTGADAYFIDTTYAAGLVECFAPAHPLTRWDDMKWKQAISDYARGQFGIFGSECGREWAIPHSDFFEGFTGVSGGYYHDAGLLKKVGGVPVPLFEMVYRDCIAMYGKYGYEPALAAEYVLHHLSLGRPLHYHNIPAHLYWKEAATERDQLGVRAAVSAFEQTGPRQFRISYLWTVSKTPKDDWRVFVHFTDASGAIRLQQDHAPVPRTSQWAAGQVQEGPFTVDLPEGVSGPLDLRIGLFDMGGASGGRALLLGRHDGERRYSLGKLKLAEGKIEFEGRRAAPLSLAGDASVFTHAENGWAEGLHPLDRFVKNTYEILSPLNELTARTLLVGHQFLTGDRKAQRSVFGNGADAVEVTVNAGSSHFRCAAKKGGEVDLPPYGFLVESRLFTAFHALSWGGKQYAAPVLFTLRSLDGKPLDRSRRVRVYHGFGDAELRLGAKTVTVQKEAVVDGRK